MLRPGPYSDGGGSGVHKSSWLTDYNCLSGDAGGLPGYPVNVAGECSTGGVSYKTQAACTGASGTWRAYTTGDALVAGEKQCGPTGAGPYCV